MAIVLPFRGFPSLPYVWLYVGGSTDKNGDINGDICTLMHIKCSKKVTVFENRSETDHPIGGKL